MPGAKVLSIEALASLSEQWRAFAAEAEQVLAEIEARVASARDVAAELHQSARFRAEEAHETLRSVESQSDDDDGAGSELEGAEKDCEAAESDLAEIEAAQTELDNCYHDYRSVARKLGFIAGDGATGAVNFLQEKVRLLNAVNSLSPDNPVAHSHFQKGESPGNSATTPHSEPTIENLSAYRLPAGFRWVPLDQIDLDYELREVKGPADFRSHAPYGEMVRGYGVLLSQILSAIQKPHADSTTFAESDRAAGVPTENGTQRVFDAFFGSDPIALDRGVRGTGFSIQNGRHRIKVAHDLGWKAIPVKETKGICP